jgi:hypothetical protein
MKIKKHPPIIYLLIIFFIILILCGIIIFTITYEKSSELNSEIKTGVEILAKKESQNPYKMEENINFLKNKAANASDYSIIFGSSVIIGDSIAEGLNLYGYLKPSSLITHLGKSVASSFDDLPTLVKIAPRNVFFELGLNDLSHPDRDLDIFIKNYSHLIDEIKQKLPDTTLYICSIFPVTDNVLIQRPEFQQIETYNNAIKELADNKGVYYIDTYTFLKENPQYHEEDGIHVISEFYPLWLDTLKNNSNIINTL